MLKRALIAVALTLLLTLGFAGTAAAYCAPKPCTGQQCHPTTTTTTVPPTTTTTQPVVTTTTTPVVTTTTAPPPPVVITTTTPTTVPPPVSTLTSQPPIAQPPAGSPGACNGPYGGFAGCSGAGENGGAGPQTSSVNQTPDLTATHPGQINISREGPQAGPMPGTLAYTGNPPIWHLIALGGILMALGAFLVRRKKVA